MLALNVGGFDMPLVTLLDLREQWQWNVLIYETHSFTFG